MKVKRSFDGWTLLPENNKDRQMIREIWNYMYPKLQIKRLGKNPKLVLHWALRRHPCKGMVRTITVYVYSGVEKKDEKKS